MEVCFGLFATFFTTFIPNNIDHKLMPGLHLIPHPITYDTGFRYSDDSVAKAGTECSKQRDYIEGLDAYEILQGINWYNITLKEKYGSSDARLHCLPVKCSNK